MGLTNHLLYLSEAVCPDGSPREQQYFTKCGCDSSTTAGLLTGKYDLSVNVVVTQGGWQLWVFLF
jgi:hypothetical protein